MDTFQLRTKAAPTNVQPPELAEHDGIWPEDHYTTIAVADDKFYLAKEWEPASNPIFQLFPANSSCCLPVSLELSSLMSFGVATAGSPSVFHALAKGRVKLSERLVHAFRARPATHSFVDPWQVRAYIADDNTPQA